MPHLPSPAASPVFVKRSISTALESPHPAKRFKVATSTSTLSATFPSMPPCDPPPPLRHSESSIYSLVHDIIRCAKDSRAGDDVQFVVDLTSAGPITTHVLDRVDVPVTNPYLDALTRPAPRTGVPRSRAAPIPVPNNRVSFPSSSSSSSPSSSSSTYPPVPHPHRPSPSHNTHPPSASSPSSKMPNEIIKSLDPTQVPIHNPGPPLKTSASSPSPQTNLTLALRRDGSGAQKVEDERCVGGLPRSTSVDHHSQPSAAVRSPSSTPTPSPQPQPQTHRTFTFADIDAMVAQSTARAAELEERAREFVEEARRLRVQGRQLAGLKEFVGGARGGAPSESESGGGRSDVDGEREEKVEEEKQENSGGKRKRGVRVKMEDGV